MFLGSFVFFFNLYQAYFSFITGRVVVLSKYNDVFHHFLYDIQSTLLGVLVGILLLAGAGTLCVGPVGLYLSSQQFWFRCLKFDKHRFGTALFPKPVGYSYQTNC